MASNAQQPTKQATRNGRLGEICSAPREGKRHDGRYDFRSAHSRSPENIRFRPQTLVFCFSASFERRTPSCHVLDSVRKAGNSVGHRIGKQPCSANAADRELAPTVAKKVRRFGARSGTNRWTGRAAAE